MSKRKLRLFTAVLLIVLVQGASALTPAQSQKLDDDLLKTPIDGSRVVGGTTFKTLEKLASVYKIPVGFEDTSQPNPPGNGSPETEKRIGLFKGTLEAFLNYLLQVEPGYSWELRDGVIDVFPTQLRSPKLSAILDTQIKEFTLRPMSGVLGAGDHICRTEEVKSKLKSLGITPIHFYQNDELEKVLPQKAPVKLTDMKVRDILNELVKYNRAEMWTAATWGAANELLTITLR